MGNFDEINSILVPVDYSETSRLACQYALHVAHRTNASLTIFHAFHSPAYDLIELTGNKSEQIKLWDEVTSKLSQVEEKSLESFLTGISGSKNPNGSGPIVISRIIRPGLAKDEIQKYAREYRPDLVIMGAKGKDKKGNSIIGSTAEIAIKKVKFPVLTVPQDYLLTDIQEKRKLLFLTEYDESDFMSVIELIRFARQLNLSIYCLHVGSRSGKWEKIKMKGLQVYFNTTYEDIPVDCDVLSHEGNPFKAIDNFIKSNAIGLLSLTSRKRNLLEKFIKPNQECQVSYQTSTPMLVFHF